MRGCRALEETGRDSMPAVPYVPESITVRMSAMASAVTLIAKAKPLGEPEARGICGSSRRQEIAPALGDDDQKPGLGLPEEPA
jgi:hypothetical protein